MKNKKTITIIVIVILAGIFLARFDFFTLTGDSFNNFDRCISVNSEDNFRFIIWRWQYDGKPFDKTYLYWGADGTTSSGSMESGVIVSTVMARGSDDGQVSGGFPWVARKYIISKTPLSDSEVRKCIPQYNMVQDVAATPAPNTGVDGVCTKGADVQIVDVLHQYSIFEGDANKEIPITVSLYNLNEIAPSSTFLECGIYPSNMPYIQQYFPLAFVPVTQCVSTEDNVRTVRVEDLIKGQVQPVTLSPLFVDTGADDYTVVCGLYTQCGSGHNNECDRHNMFDGREARFEIGFFTEWVGNIKMYRAEQYEEYLEQPDTTAPYVDKFISSPPGSENTGGSSTEGVKSIILGGVTAPIASILLLIVVVVGGLYLLKRKGFI